MKNILKIYKNNSNIADIVLLCICVFAAYVNVYNCGFVFDDKIVIVNNQNIKSFRYLTDIFTGEFFDIDMRFSKGGYYRPLIIFSFMLEYFLWKLNATGYHIVNVLIHLCNVLLVFNLLKLVLKKTNIAFYAALFFAVHPVQTSAVTYISGRTDLLALFFMLLFLITGFKWCVDYAKNKYMAAAFGFYFLALLCKEVSIISFVLLLIILLYRNIYFYKVKKLYVFLGGCCGTAFVYLICRAVALDTFNHSSNLGVFSNIGLRLALLPGIILDYFKIIVFPLNLHFERFVILPKSISEYVFSFKGLVTYFVFAGLLFFYYRYSKKFKILHFGVFFFFVAFFPGLQIVPIMVSGKLFTPEHFLYIPLIAFFAVVFFFLDKVRIRNQKKLKIFIWGLVLVFIFLSLKRNMIFKNNITFYQNTSLHSEGSSRLHNNLGNSYSDKGLYKEAYLAYQKAIKIDASYAQTYLNLGNLFVRQNLYDKAVPFYEKATQLKPNDYMLFSNIGVLFDKQKKYKEAAKYLKKAIALKPNYKEAYDNLGTVYFNANNKDAALKAYFKAVEIDADYGAAYFHIGNVYMSQKRDNDAQVYFHKALKTSSPYIQAYNNLGIVLKRQGRLVEALEVYKKAVKINPRNLNFYNNMGAVYEDLGEYDKAVSCFGQVYKVAPNDMNTLYNMGNVLIKIKEYKKAVSYLQKAYYIAPNDVDVILSLSYAYTALGKKSEAKKVLQRGVKLYPQNKQIKNNLASI